MKSKILKDLFTGIDGESHDIGRYLWAISILVGITYAGIDLFMLKNPFNIVNYGIGIGGLLAAGGGALLLKKTTEPSEKL